MAAGICVARLRNLGSALIVTAAVGEPLQKCLNTFFAKNLRNGRAKLLLSFFRPPHQVHKPLKQRTNACERGSKFDFREGESISGGPSGLRRYAREDGTVRLAPLRWN